MLIIRDEQPEDADAVRRVNDRAFAQGGEGLLVERLRTRGMLTVSLVAVKDGRIVGHIAFSPVAVECTDGAFDATALGPMAVLPEYQKQGTGSRLVRAGLEKCRCLGRDIVVLVGHPDYYPRFGFAPAGDRGLECEFPVPDEAWMVLELKAGALAGRRGVVRYQPEFREVA